MKTFRWAFGTYFLAQLGDILSSLFSNRIGLEESNHLMADPNTGMFLLKPALIVKSLFFAVALLSMVFGIYKATKNQVLASVPIFWEAYIGFGVTFHNLVLAWAVTHLGRS